MWTTWTILALWISPAIFLAMHFPGLYLRYRQFSIIIIIIIIRNLYSAIMPLGGYRGYTASPAAHIPFPISAVLQAYHSASFCVARIGLSDSGFFELCFVSLPCSTSSIAGRWLLIFHHFQSVNPLLGRSQLAGACLYVLLTDTTEWRDRPNQWKL